MEELKRQIMAALLEYLEDDEEISSDKVGVLTNRAMLAYRGYRNYPDSWDEGAILADMTKHIGCITDLAMYEYIQQGAEFQTMHIESGLYRMWQSQGSVYSRHRVVPFVTV
jgi:hypothetical protein